MMRACLFLLAGMFAPQLGSIPVASDHYPVLLVSGIALALLRQLRMAGLTILGAGLFGQAVAAVVDTRIDPAWVGDGLLVTVRVVDFAGKRDATTTFVGAPTDDSRLPPRVRISWSEAPVAVHPGDTWRLELRLQRPRGASNPGAFDYEAWLTRERIGATAYVVAGPRNHLAASGGGSPLMRFRERFVDRLDAAIPDPHARAVLAALAVGARHLLTQEQWDDFARTGTTHLMAISGLHVGLAAAAGYWLGRLLGMFLPVSRNAHRAAVSLAVTVAGLYAAVSGFAVPSQRAGIMLLAGAIAVLLSRQPDPVRFVAMAALLLAGSNPLITMSPGFRLSFGAVMTLLWFARSQAGGRGIAVRTRQLATIQVWLLLGLLPLIGPMFGRITLAAPLTNLVAVPLFSFVTVPAALAGLILQGPLQLAGDMCLRLAAFSIGILDPLLASLAKASLLTVPLPTLAGTGFVLVLLPAVLVLLPAGWPGRCLAWLGLVALIGYTPATPRPGCASLTVLDVGQGLAAVIQTRAHVLVYDTGPRYFSGGDSAAAVLLPYLQSRGIRKIDRLVISHGDLDHAGGARTVVDSVVVGDVLLGEDIELPEIVPRRCVAGMAWSWDDVRFEMLHPERTAGVTGNDASCVLRISAGRQAALLPGDIERPAETELVDRDVLQPVDVVVMPHHGSATSSSPGFVNAVSPRIAIAPTGFGNRWRFPSRDVAARWQEAGATVLTTAESGAITVDLCASVTGPLVRESRKERRRIWHE